jgi:hypothetical protein
MTKKLGFAYWGFCEEYEDSKVVETPDGGRFTRPLFVKEMTKAGYEVIALQEQREQKPIKELSFSDTFPENLDALFVEWRWPTWKNDPQNPNFKTESYESDLVRQVSLMNYYHGKIPIIVWDTDLKVTDEDIEKWPQVTWMEPTILHDRHNFSSLLYFSDFEVKYKPKKPSNRYIYIGSNYERYWGVDKYYYSVAAELRRMAIVTDFYGNWLNYSPERPEQEEKVKAYSDRINFHKRNSFLEGMELINDSICTTHIVKKEYCRKGLITPRFFESIMAGTPALIPEEFIVPIYGRRWVIGGTHEDIFDKIYFLAGRDAFDRECIIETQIASIREKLPECDVKNVPPKITKVLGF